MLRKKKAAAAASDQVDRREEEETKAAAGGAPATIKRTPGQIRLTKDMQELDKPAFITMNVDQSNIMQFGLSMDLRNEQDSIWKGGQFAFTVNVPSEYPHKPPVVHCDTPVYHPNIDTEGKVCLNILRADWKPVLDIGNVIMGLIFLFLEPNPNDPLNHEAAAEFRENVNRFKQNVSRSLRGEVVQGIRYPR